MYDNINFVAANAYEQERKKINKSNAIDKVNKKLKEKNSKHKNGDEFKNILEHIQEDSNILDAEEDIIVDLSLTNKLEENRIMSKLVKERLLDNPSTKEMLSKEYAEELPLEKQGE